MQQESLRDRKKRETRRAISNVATRLFIERGFDAVTVAEIAEAADVSKMTVFNYFARKEDLFFDRESEARELIRDALLRRPRGQRPLRALQRLARTLLAEEHPFARFNSSVLTFWRIVDESAALRARMREVRVEAEAELALLLVASVGSKRDDPLARLFAALLVAAWATAYAEGLQRLRAGGSTAAARKAFLALLDRGFATLVAGARGTPYA